MSATQPTSGSIGRSGRPTRAWVLVTRVLVIGVFCQAIFAGTLLSGQVWGRTVHGYLGPALVITSLVSAVTAFVGRQRWSGGGRLAVLLTVLTVVLLVQNVLGEMSTGGDLLWLHVPLGVAAVGLAAQPAIVAGRMTTSDDDGPISDG